MTVLDMYRLVVGVAIVAATAGCSRWLWQHRHNPVPPVVINGVRHHSWQSFVTICGWWSIVVVAVAEVRS